jgi:CRISPR-associated endonuclease Csn1
MKDLLKDRFERLQGLTGAKLISYSENEKGERNMHLDGYEKRIDHRHHALDALVIAYTSQGHVQYINTLEAQSKDKNEKFKFQKLLKSGKVRDFNQP